MRSSSGDLRTLVPGHATIRIAVALFLVVVSAGFVAAQGVIATVERTSPVMEQPRGDSVVIGSVQPGDTIHLIAQQGAWFQIELPPERVSPWRQGWIPRSAITPATLPPTLSAQPGEDAQQPRPPGRMMLRIFGHGGGVLFAAKDSFEAVLDRSFGPVFGGGAQVVFPSGGFLQASVDYFSQDGRMVVIGDDQVYALGTPVAVKVTPIQVTLGYRVGREGSQAWYAGGGVGLYRYREESDALEHAISLHKAGYHALGGIEFPLMSRLSLAGEAQWTAVPKALGEAGLSSAFDEDDLGGTTFRVKVIATF